MPEEAAPQPWHGLYWRAWSALRYDRQYDGFGGEMPVSYMAIRAYAKENGIAGADFTTFLHLFRAIDAEWLAHQATQLKDKQKTP